MATTSNSLLGAQFPEELVPDGAPVYIPEEGYDEQIIPELIAEEEID